MIAEKLLQNILDLYLWLLFTSNPTYSISLCQVPTETINGLKSSTKGSLRVWLTRGAEHAPNALLDNRQVSSTHTKYMVAMIIEKLELMAVGYPTTMGVKKLYDNKPVICW